MFDATHLFTDYAYGLSMIRISKSQKIKSKYTQVIDALVVQKNVLRYYIISSCFLVGEMNSILWLV